MFALLSQVSDHLSYRKRVEQSAVTFLQLFYSSESRVSLTEKSSFSHQNMFEKTNFGATEVAQLLYITSFYLITNELTHALIY